MTLTTTVRLTQYGNGWRDYGGGNATEFAPVYATKDPNGFVSIDGLVDKNGGSFVAYEAILQLPPGFAPAVSQIFVVQASGGGSTGQAEMRVGGTAPGSTGVGTIYLGGEGGPANPVTWVSLCPLNWRTA